MGMKEEYLQWFTSFLTKQCKGSGIKSMSNKQLANICGADLANIQLISKYNKGFLLDYYYM